MKQKQTGQNAKGALTGKGYRVSHVLNSGNKNCNSVGS